MRWGILGALVIASLALGVACSEEGATRRPRKPSSASGGRTTGPEGEEEPEPPRGPIGTPSEPDPERRPGTPEGWVLHRAFDTRCELYAPARKEQLPPPVTWEPCPAALVGADSGAGIACRSQAATEQADLDAVSITATGVVRIAGRRADTWFIADADGEVQAALYEAAPSFCAVGAARINGDRYAVPLKITRSNIRSGALAGQIGGLAPHIGLTLDTPLAVHPTAFTILTPSADLHWLEEYPWTAPPADPHLLWAPAESRKMKQGAIASRDDAILWTANDDSDPHLSKLVLYTAGRAPRGIASSAGAFTYTAPALDGKSIAYLAGSANPDGTLGYDLLTVPYSLSTTTLGTPRRLARLGDPRGPLLLNGCGHAATRDGAIVGIYRLADGRSWEIPAPAFGQAYDLLALSCDELFAIGHPASGPGWILVRIRLDSLGPGKPSPFG